MDSAHEINSVTSEIYKENVANVSKKKNSNRVNLNLLHQNICGINNKRDQLELYLECLQKISDYVCISEHFLNQNSIEHFKLSNYNVITFYARTKKIRGGTLILGLNNKNYTEIDCRKYARVESFELCGVKDLNSDINIFCCYQNNKNYASFLENLELFLQIYFDKKVVIMGDFNVNLHNDDCKAREFLNLLKCYNFRALIQNTTFIRNNTQSCIDNILTNIHEESVESATVDHNGLADGHAAVIAELMVESIRCDKWKEKVVFVERRKFCNTNNILFRQNITNINWKNLGINGFLRTFTETFKKSFRKTKRKIKSKNFDQITWITKGIRVSSMMKRVLCNIDKTHNDISLINYKKAYISVYRKVLRAARSLAVQVKISKEKYKAKGVWEVVNNEGGKKNITRERKNIVLQSSDGIVTDPLKIAQIFSVQFDHSLLPFPGFGAQALHLLIENSARVQNDMFFRTVSAKEVCDIVRSMETKKSCGYDDMPISVIKDNIDLLDVNLALFFNRCVDECRFPDQLKIARILPVYKKKSKFDPKNYRPISLLPVLSKVFEKLIKTRLLAHLIRNQVLDTRQFGYQRGIGTADAIDALMKDVVINLNKRLKVAGLFLDLSSAFDMVNHKILLDKLEHYGVRNGVLKLLESYLSNRKQFVEVKSVANNGTESTKTSKLVNITRGVPQGSILGPIFFLVFVNDLVNHVVSKVPSAKLVLFADDSNAILSGPDIKELNERANATLKAFDNWFVANDLQLNLQKTNAILFRSTTRNQDYLSLSLNNQKIELVNEVKFLGIHIDSLLNWKAELSTLEGSISSACYALRSLRDLLTLDQLKSVYCALIESRLRYSIKHWGGSYNYNLQKAFIVQKRAIRTIARIPPWESCRDYFKAYKILTVPSLYILVLLVDLVKHRSFFETKDNMRLRLATRRKDLDHIIVPNFNVVKHSPLYKTVVFFNRLPTELKIISSVDVFKDKLRLFLLEKNFYSVDEYFTN